MLNISFDNDEKYDVIVIDEENEVYKCKINQKAFSKTIGTSTLWEYIESNGIHESRKNTKNKAI